MKITINSKEGAALMEGAKAIAEERKKAEAEEAAAKAEAEAKEAIARAVAKAEAEAKAAIARAEAMEERENAENLTNTLETYNVIIPEKGTVEKFINPCGGFQTIKWALRKWRELREEYPGIFFMHEDDYMEDMDGPYVCFAR